MFFIFLKIINITVEFCSVLANRKKFRSFAQSFEV